MKCNICQTTNPQNFYPSKPTRCMTCLAEVSAQYYAKNKEKVYSNLVDRTTSFQEFIDGYKINPCADCFKTFPSYCMDFVYNNIAEKSFDISEAALNKRTKEEIINEIKKCHLVCACCARVRKQTEKALKMETIMNKVKAKKKKEMRISGNTITFDDFSITLHRTLRLPEDGNTHNLPPSLGSFPIKRVEDYLDKVPPSWIAHGGIFIPMFQREAMWMSFHSANGKHHAVKVATGKVNALNGKKWSPELKGSSNVNGKDPEQDYMVSPLQPWLDGFNVGDDTIRQFVAMPLGNGYSVEGQITGKEEFGGLQLMIFPEKPGMIKEQPRQFFKDGTYTLPFIYPIYTYPYTYPLNSSSPSININPAPNYTIDGGGGLYSSAAMSTLTYSDNNASYSFSLNSTIDASNNITNPTLFNISTEMGLGQGGKMYQHIYKDPYGVECWDQENAKKVFIHIVNSEMYKQITGEEPPPCPINAHTYKQYGYSWYKLYDEDVSAIQGSGTLANVKPISEKDAENGVRSSDNNSELKEDSVIEIKKEPVVIDKFAIKDGDW